MFKVHMHKNVLADPVAAPGGGNINQYGVANFWYDGSRYQYVTPTGLANPGTTTNLLSKFAGGPGLATKTMQGATTFSLPDYYRTYSATLSAIPCPNFTAYIAPGASSTFTGTITQSTDGGPNATLTTSTTPTGAGIIIGAIITGGTIPANTWVAADLPGNDWTLTCSAGTAIPTNAVATTYTVTPIVMTVTAVASGMISVNGLIYHATSANITALTFITGLGTGTGGIGTYYVSISQTKGTSGTPISGYVCCMNYLNFNSGDGYRVGMTNSNILTGYTILMAIKLGANTGTVGILNTDHNLGKSGVLGEGIGRNGTTLTYRCAGATANGANVNTVGWHIHSMVYDGTGGTNATKFKARIDGVSSNLTFTGTVGSSTVDPSPLIITAANTTGANIISNVCTVNFSNINSPPFNIGQNITLNGWVTAGTANINGTYAVSNCTNGSVSFSATGTLTSVTTKGTTTGVPIVNLYMDGNSPNNYTATITNSNATSQGLLLGELIVYNSTLSTAEIGAVEQYLKNKWLGTN
jgi:hypothetical protein